MTKRVKRSTSAPTDAEVAELTALLNEDGLLTEEAVLKRARNPKNVLHARFTWDDHEAARLRRLDEARTLIREVRVRIIRRPDEPPIQVRAFVSLAADRVKGGGYRPIEVVLRDADLRAELLRTALAELQTLQRRYRHLSELAQVFAALDNTLTEHKSIAG